MLGLSISSLPVGVSCILGPPKDEGKGKDNFDLAAAMVDGMQ